ncbi:hypothetical protein L6452_07975 [Arctium lappa]|uniref:Uncharacterized protein n=1 Tax=Arctium lappa TaxID=4217 RepID=A0ACB9DGC0_ARCLA|nr:hypothetical protein L6452_07975 [Arctium lappa]
MRGRLGEEGMFVRIILNYPVGELLGTRFPGTPTGAGPKSPTTGACNGNMIPVEAGSYAPVKAGFCAPVTRGAGAGPCMHVSPIVHGLGTSITGTGIDRYCSGAADALEVLDNKNDKS